MRLIQVAHIGGTGQRYIFIGEDKIWLSSDSIGDDTFTEIVNFEQFKSIVDDSDLLFIYYGLVCQIPFEYDTEISRIKTKVLVLYGNNVGQEYVINKIRKVFENFKKHTDNPTLSLYELLVKASNNCPDDINIAEVK
jgi:hypothetical protein